MPTVVQAATGSVQGIHAANAGVQAAAAALHNYTLLEERARAASTVPELLFSIANEVWQLFPYRQAIVWSTEGRKPRLRIVSGLAQLAEDSPYTVWLRRLGDEIGRRNQREPEFVAADDLPASLREGWQEWLPSYLLVYPIITPARQRVGFVAYALEEAPADHAQELAGRLMAAYGHAWQGLAPARRTTAIRSAWRWLGWGALALAMIALVIPIRLSVLANAEVIALDAMAISSPMDGVIKTFHVQPNQVVKRDQLLFTLDETTLRNRREVAIKQFQVARADALAAAQKAFESAQSRAELASLNGKVAEKQAEVAYVDDLMKRIEVRSPGEGVLVFGDINDWQGKPVVTGERVALLADPKDAGVLIWLPVSDAINLNEGAPVRLYLQVAPLQPLSGTLSQTSYQAVQSPDGISAYRLRARFADLTESQRKLARIGLKGTAKIYGERAPLGYYLFRRPLSTLRELTGL
jgi:multidrug resistance efflux pump